jgi:hypothetical protein
MIEEKTIVRDRLSLDLRAVEAVRTRLRKREVRNLRTFEPVSVNGRLRLSRTRLARAAERTLDAEIARREVFARPTLTERLRGAPTRLPDLRARVEVIVKALGLEIRAFFTTVPESVSGRENLRLVFRANVD